MNTKTQTHPLLKALICIFISLGFLQVSYAQSPNAIPYQGVARDASGAILPSQPIGLRYSIHDISAGGPVVFSETFTTTTTNLGLFNINIGTGTPGVGTLAAVNWGGGAKFVQVEMDPAGGTAYINMGTTQLNSVPYALYAAGAGTLPDGTALGNTLRWNGASWIADNGIFNNGTQVGIGTTTPAALTQLDIHGNVTQMRLMDDDDNSELWFSAPGTGYSGGMGTSTNHDLALFTNNTDRMTIKASGEVGIGTTAPAFNFELNNTTANPTSYILQDNPANTSNALLVRNRDNLNASGVFNDNAVSAIRGSSGTVTYLTNTRTSIYSGTASDDVNGIGVQGYGPFSGIMGLSGDGGSGLYGWNTSPTGYALSTLGRIQINGQGAGLNKVLRSDAVGNATWESLGSIGAIAGTGTLNYLPKWTPDGATIGNSQIFDDGTRMGIGTATPVSKLQIITSGAGFSPGVNISNNRLGQGASAFIITGLDVIDSSDNAGNIENTAIRGFYGGNGGGFINVGVRGWALQNSSPVSFNGASKIAAADFYGVHGTGQVGVMGVASGPGALYGVVSRGSARIDGKLEANGVVQITDGTEGAGKVLTSDATGNASWQAVTPKVSIRLTGLSSDVVLPFAYIPITQWQTIVFEEGGANYNSTTGEYTVPVAGVYNISANLDFYDIASNGYSTIAVRVNGVQVSNTRESGAGGTFPGNKMSSTVKVNAGDKISIWAFANPGYTCIGAGVFCNLSITLIR